MYTVSRRYYQAGCISQADTQGAGMDCQQQIQELVLPSHHHSGQRVQQLMYENVSKDDLLVFTGGSLHCEERSGWGFSARIREIIAKQISVYSLQPKTSEWTGLHLLWLSVGKQVPVSPEEKRWLIQSIMHTCLT